MMRRRRGGDRKQFFFEKKNQKTFIGLVWVSGWDRDGHQSFPREGFIKPKLICISTDIRSMTHDSEGAGQ
jgi:hypothetical protein